VEVLNDQGNSAHDTLYKRSLKGKGRCDEAGRCYLGFMGSIITYFLKPGETIKDGLTLNRLYDLTKPGKYTIQCQRFDEESNSWVKSNKITITVTP
jgi:hypothetical protein